MNGTIHRIVRPPCVIGFAIRGIDRRWYAEHNSVVVNVARYCRYVGINVLIRPEFVNSRLIFPEPASSI